MTLEELSRYSWIRDQIQITRQRLEDMRAALEPRSPRFDGMPHAPGPHDKIGELVPEIVDQEQELIRLLQALEDQRGEIWRWIDGITDLRIRLIASLRIEKGLQWEQVADELGGRATGPGCRTAFHRWIRAHDGEGRKKPHRAPLTASSNPEGIYTR